MGDFVSTVFSDWLITDMIADLFEKQRLTGYKLREVDISNKVLPFKLWEIVVIGRANIHSDSGMKVIYQCEHCGLVMHGASNESTGIIIDKKTWDGSDFFELEESRRVVFVTEKVKKVIDDHKLTGVLLVPSTELRLGYSSANVDQNWSTKQWKEYFEHL
jgi:hypothetical protein